MNTATGKTVVVYDRHGEQHVVPAIAAQWLVEGGRLLREPPVNPMPHKNPNGPGYKWTEVGADGNSVTDYFGFEPPSAEYLARHNIPYTYP